MPSKCHQKPPNAIKSHQMTIKDNQMAIKGNQGAEGRAPASREKPKRRSPPRRRACAATAAQGFGQRANGFSGRGAGQPRTPAPGNGCSKR
eukprot:127898-Prymnesium_polylepis.1